MTDKMLKFVKIGQQTPPKREVENRKEDFNEIYDDFIKQKAQEQSSRCSQCGVPFCQVHCPLSNNIPDWLKLTAEGRLKEAYELSQSTNNMPEVCGRICPQDRLCEGNCVIEQSGHGTVTIGSVEKYITDSAWENGWVKPISVKHEKDQSIGIIGALSRNVPFKWSLISSETISRKSSSAKEILVRAIKPFLTPSRFNMRRCSSDWGFHPSVLSTTKRHPSTAPTPASIFFKNLS